MTRERFTKETRCPSTWPKTRGGAFTFSIELTLLSHHIESVNWSVIELLLTIEKISIITRCGSCILRISAKSTKHGITLITHSTLSLSRTGALRARLVRLVQPAKVETVQVCVCVCVCVCVHACICLGLL